jgi:hypothetical protein
MTKRAGDEVVNLLKDLTDPAPKAPARIPPVSARRRSRAAEREAVVAEVLTRPGPRCEMARWVPEVRCGSLTTPERPHAIEVDEIRGGAWRVTEMYDASRCQRGCHRHHDWKTANKQEYRRRMGELA